MDNGHGCAVAMGFLIHGGIIIIFIFIRIHKKAIAIDIFFSENSAQVSANRGYAWTNCPVPRGGTTTLLQVQL
jgi:hypothetical protein